MKIRKQLVKIKDQGFHYTVMMEHSVWPCNLGIFMSSDVNLTNSQTFLSFFSVRYTDQSTFFVRPKCVQWYGILISLQPVFDGNKYFFSNYRGLRY
jgi:hypothetical protein